MSWTLVLAGCSVIIALSALYHVARLYAQVIHLTEFTLQLYYGIREGIEIELTEEDE